MTRWYETVYNQPIFSAVVDKLKFIDQALPNQPPKTEKQEKPKKQEKAKEAPKPKAKEVDEEDEEEDKPAPKPKHPLEALPKPTVALDDLKRKYSNEETREVALPWFWENFNAEEYSLWKCDYKYNEELTQTFMTANLIGMHSCLDSACLLWTPLTYHLQVDFSPVWKLPASTSLGLLPSTVSRMIPSSKAPSSSADKRKSRLLMLRLITTAMSSQSWILASLKTRNSSMTNGHGINRLKSRVRLMSGPTEKSSNRPCVTSARNPGMDDATVRTQRAAHFCADV